MVALRRMYAFISHQGSKLTRRTVREIHFPRVCNIENRIHPRSNDGFNHHFTAKRFSLTLISNSDYSIPTGQLIQVQDGYKNTRTRAREDMYNK